MNILKYQINKQFYFALTHELYFLTYDIIYDIYLTVG